MKRPTTPFHRLDTRRGRIAPQVLAVVWLALGTVAAPYAAENWMFSTPEPLPSPINLPNTFSASPWLTADGLTVYFASDRPGGYGKWDLWVATRGSIHENWGEPVNLGPTINTAGPEHFAGWAVGPGERVVRAEPGRHPSRRRRVGYGLASTLLSREAERRGRQRSPAFG